MNARISVSRLTLWIAVLVCGMAVDGAAGDDGATPPVSLKRFARIVVMESGRKKPMDTYARTTLLRLSGKRSLGDRDALEWLAGLVFDPPSVGDERVFLSDTPEIADALGIERRKRRYSFTDIHPGFRKLEALAARARELNGSDLSAFDRELIRLHTNTMLYMRLFAALGFLDPYPAFRVTDSALAAGLGLDSAGMMLSCWELMRHSDTLRSVMLAVRNTPAEERTATENAVVSLVSGLYRTTASMGNPPPHLIPAIDSGREQWYGPWGYIAAMGSSSLRDPLVSGLAAMRRAYRSGDSRAFDRAVEGFIEAANAVGGVEMPEVELEVLYNAVKPFPRAKVLYGLVLLCALAALVWPAMTTPGIITAASLAVVGLLLQTLGMGARMIIMGRPPVTNLYETFVFVAWSCAVLGVVLEAMQRNGLGMLVAGAGGFGFLHVAGRYGLDGDTMGMLAAVLNNNFWLATHIITIALGYAGCAASALVAHVYLIRRAMTGNARETAPVDGAVYGLLLFGLAFTVVGTVFGGLWADQSWGRFWGWDPKENGALLIILWSSAVVHARRGRMIAAIGTAVGSVLGFVLVMFAWLGVNLLGVGMHAYGWTSSGARLLFTVAGVELVFVAVMLAVLRLRRGKTSTV